ncbi:hypothetical protein SPBR_02966 [Sporothrix brasiliensis 5110]|uniref:Carbohydrate-binding module family 18 protein n=1 Tax=Sporothrix brasiliensis 5110 TaxID=1398154 RepID=A0A0C2IZ85_9PEZI|nr:uncharacterized protein SPBR_02966 [Sporothrix brasiliensis 5110]KIH92040.1 hypothetical protein SPBR_02966 [Sporothrix brasiliensis 5110]
MRAWSSLLVAAASVSGATADVALDNKIALVNREALLRPGVLEYDNRDKHYVVLPVVGGKFQAKTGTNSSDGVVTSRSVIDILLNKRQYCSAGYGYCSNFGRCCPTYDDCCAYGYCIDPADTCCPNAPCQDGHGCCGQNHCYPPGAVCCGDESYCDAGNHCYKYADLSYDVCCTDSSCTAYVTGGVTVTRSQTTTRTYTTPPPSTATDYNYEAYYFTITYYYYYYYWYEIDVTRSVVTSTRTTTRTILSVSATDSAEARSSFSEISSTFTPYTPAAATSLESLAGSTTTDEPASFGGGSPGGDSSSSPAPTSSAEQTTTRHRATTTTTTPTLPNGAGSVNSAVSLTHAGDGLLGLWLTVGAAAGILMIVL